MLQVICTFLIASILCTKLVVQSHVFLDVDKRLSDLPSELLSIVVGHLAPSYENRFKPGQKKDLQSASFAHRCLRQWVPQLLFRNMCLIVVTVGLPSKLEGMLLDPLGLELA